MTKKTGAGVMAGFQKMRRRLTVTGASETIDGVSRLSMSDARNEETLKVRCFFRELKLFMFRLGTNVKLFDTLCMTIDSSSHTSLPSFFPFPHILFCYTSIHSFIQPLHVQ